MILQFFTSSSRDFIFATLILYTQSWKTCKRDGGEKLEEKTVERFKAGDREKVSEDIGVKVVRVLTIILLYPNS